MIVSGEVTYNAGILYAACTPPTVPAAPPAFSYKIYPTLNRNNDNGCPSSGNFYNLCPQITSATILDETVLDHGGNSSTFYPTMQPDPEGNNTTVFNFIAPTANFYPTTGYISRRVSQSPGSFVDTAMPRISGSRPRGWGLSVS